MRKSLIKSPNKLRSLYLGVGSLFLTTTGVGLSYGWFLVHKLSPLVEIELTKLLDRPVEIGEVESFSPFGGITFSQSQIPSTALAKDYIDIERIRVNFNPWTLVIRRQLNLRINLIQPTIYLEQKQDQSWLLTKLLNQPPQDLPNLQINLQYISLTDANIAIAPRNHQGTLQTPVEAFFSFTQWRWYPQQLLEFSLIGQLNQGGDFQITGTMDIPTENINLLVRGNQLNATPISNLLSVPLTVEEGRIDTNLEIKLRKEQLPQLRGIVNLDNIQAITPDLPKRITQTRGEIRFLDQQIQVEARSQLGLISLDTHGTIDLEQGLNLKIKSLPISITEGIESLDLPNVPIDIQGEVKANLSITGTLKQPQLAINFSNHQSILVGVNEFKSISGLLNWSNNIVTIEQLQAIPSLGGIVTAAGYINLTDTGGNFVVNFTGSQLFFRESLKIITTEGNIFGSLDNLSQIQGEIKAELSLGKGIINVDSFQFIGLNWQTDLKITNLNLADLGINHPQLPNNYLNSQLTLTGENIDLTKIDATGEVNLTSDYGIIRTNNFKVNQGNWSSEIESEDLDLFLNLNGKLSNSLNDFTAKGHGNLALKNLGKILIESLDISEGKIITRILTHNLDLDKFSLTANTEIRADLSNLSLTGIKARGNLHLSQGLINYPISTTIYWDGNLLNLETITGEGMNGKGWIAISETGKIEDLELDILNARIDLTSLITELPLDGELFFQGKINKNNERFRVNGDLALDDLSLFGLNFEPLKGKITSNSGINLELVGQKDLILLSLNNDYQPNYLWLQQGKTQVKGDRQDNNLLVNISNLPLEFSQLLPLPIELKTISGQLSGNGLINLIDYSLVSNLIIDTPRFNKIKGEKITTNLTFYNKNIKINNLKFLQGKSEYLADLELNFSENIPKIQGKIVINQGNIQDVLEAIQIFELKDLVLGRQPRVYGDATSLAGEDKRISIGLPNGTILEQLSLISQLNFLSKSHQENNEQQPLEIPDLNLLRGNVQGELLLSGYLDSRLNADFSLTGTNWQWDNYYLDKFIITGNFGEETLNLHQVSLQSGDSFLNFVGYFNNNNQQGELNLVNIPLELINELTSLPFNLTFTGKMNAKLSLTGSRENPQAKGKIILEEMIVNNTSVYSTTADINYKNANLDFIFTSLLTNKAKPIKIEGNFPYQLPWATISPTSQEFNLSLNIEDEGLKLLNIITKEALMWQAGKGEINLDIGGVFEQKTTEITNLKTTGKIKLNQGLMISKFLPDYSLTEINGEIFFSFDHVEIPYLKANFIGGDFLVTGSLPLSQINNKQEFLDFKLTSVNLDIPELYRGKIGGNIRILGSWLDADLTGELNLDKGEIILGEINIPTFLQQGYLGRIDLAGLRLNLGEDIKLVKEPILSFVATGTLDLYGNFTNLFPEGTIQLKQGGVNLLTTYLRLAKNSQNRVRFLPNQGIDPYLELQLVGSVTESHANDLTRDPSSSEISDVSVYNFGTVETIRIQANIQGFASQLTNNLELTSSPPRSQKEILALLSGGFVDTFGNGDTTLGLANLAGGAISNSVQQELANSFGVSEFRIFPTPIIESENKTDSFGLAAEIGFDATKNFSVSILKVLTDTQPPQFGIRYRFGDRFLLRGSTDFSEDTRGILEYQLRF